MGSATAGIANTPTASTRNKNFPLRRAAENWTAFERRFPCTSHSKESREGARWCALWAKENSGRQCCTTASFAGPVEAGVLPRTAVGDRLPYSWWYRLLSPEIGNPLATGLNLFFVAVVSPGHTFTGAAFSHPRMSLGNRYRICGSLFFEFCFVRNYLGAAQRGAGQRLGLGWFW